MNIRKILLFLIFLILGPPAGRAGPPVMAGFFQEEDEKYRQADKIVENFYNNLESRESNAQSLKDAWELLKAYPNDPYFYNLWTSIEWIFIGHQLGLKIDEQKNLAILTDYSERLKKYLEIIAKGIALADSEDSRSQFFKAVLLFDRAKFLARFGDGLKGLKTADSDSAEGIKLLYGLINREEDFCPAYFLLGATKYSLTGKREDSLKAWLAIRFFSYTFPALQAIDEDVFNKKKAILWLEKSYWCGKKEPWLRKNKIETGLVLAACYGSYKEGLIKNSKAREEFEILEKEIPLLTELAEILPNRADILKRLQEARFRDGVLKNYFQSKFKKPPE